jgi:hypothetical protein
MGLNDGLKPFQFFLNFSGFQAMSWPKRNLMLYILLITFAAGLPMIADVAALGLRELAQSATASTGLRQKFARKGMNSKQVSHILAENSVIDPVLPHLEISPNVAASGQVDIDKLVKLAGADELDPVQFQNSVTKVNHFFADTAKDSPNSDFLTNPPSLSKADLKRHAKIGLSLNTAAGKIGNPLAQSQSYLTRGGLNYKQAKMLRKFGFTDKQIQLLNIHEYLF